MFERLDQLDPAAMVPRQADTPRVAEARQLIADAIEQLGRDHQSIDAFWELFGIRIMPVIAAADMERLATLLPLMSAAERDETITTALGLVRLYCGTHWPKPWAAAKA